MPQFEQISLGWLRTAVAAVLITSIPAWAAVGSESPAARTYDGTPQDVGGGRAYTFVTLDGGGKPITIGVRMSEAALSGLPTEPPSGMEGVEYVLPFPKEAESAGYTHVGLDWNPHGHVPPGIYDAPHFDFHFYLISAEQREKITAKGDDLARARKAPAPEMMPEGYILPEGTEVPRMGAHAIDPQSPEFNKQPFTKTFIYGFYDGSIAFLEPMVTKAFLETKPNVTDAVKLPQTYSPRAFYPTQYTVKYDESQREYVISLDGLTSR